MRIITTFCLCVIFFCSCGQKKADNVATTRQYAGLYDTGGDIEKGPVGSVAVYAESNSSILFYLDVNRGAPSYNMGQLYGRLMLTDGKGIFDAQMPDSNNRCTLVFTFTTGVLTITYKNEEDNDCDFGYAVSASGTYKRMNKQQPEFFKDQQGDTVHFAKTSPEVYNQE